MNKIREILKFLLELKIDKNNNIELTSSGNKSDNNKLKTKKPLTLVKFNASVLREFSELEVDEDLYDNENFAKAITEKLKLQKLAL